MTAQDSPITPLHRVISTTGTSVLQIRAAAELAQHQLPVGEVANRQDLNNLTGRIECHELSRVLAA